MDKVEALGEVLARFGRKLQEFRDGKDAVGIASEPGGHYSGYMAEARIAIGMLEERGVTLVEMPETSP